MNKELIKKYAAEVYDEIVEYRRYLHAHPEVSMSEGRPPSTWPLSWKKILFLIH